MTFWPTNWMGFLLPNAPILELFMRGTLIYLFLFLVMRLSGGRVFAGFALSDLLVVLVLAVAVREGLTGGFRTVGDAFISGGTILFWNRLIDRMAYHIPPLRKFLRQRPTPLIRDGELIIENARTQLITRAEIDEKLRASGVSSIADVREARLEPDGSFSVVTRSS